MGRSIALVLTLVMGLLLAWRELHVGEPAPVDAPDARFSAARAMFDVEWVARTPHPTGSPANQAVRDHLIGRMTELGLSPRLRRDDSLLEISHDRLEGASVETLVGVLAGADRSLPALALMAHYDSVPGAPGAADDGAGIAAALEAVRALRAEGRPARDVAVVFTDGEEAGLLGARAFFEHDALARRIGFVLNLEARGSGGRVQMFQTGRNDGGAVELFRRTAVRPSAGSLFGQVYARLPSDTDFTPARAAGIAGFNYAFLGRAFDYHSPTDTPANLQQGSLQDMGDQVLAAAQAVAFDQALPARRADAVYGVAPWGAVIAYPAAWGWAPIAIAAVLIAAAGRAARRSGLISLRETGRGLAGAGFILAGGLAVLHLAATVADARILEPRRLLAEALRWEACQLTLAAGFLVFAAGEIARGRRWAAVVLALGAGVASSVAAGAVDVLGLAAGAAGAVLAIAAGGAVSRPAAWSGLLGLGMVIAVAVQVALPQAAYVIAWPLLAGAVAALATRLGGDLRPAPLVAATLMASLGLAFALVQAHLLVVATGVPETLLLPLLMSALVIWPLIQPAPGAPAEELAAGVLLLTSVVLGAVILLSPPWTARHPQPSFVAYQLDQDAGRAWRVSRQDLRSRWSDEALSADGGRIADFAHWAWPQPMRAAPARAADAPRPQLTVARRGSGEVVLTLVTDPDVRAVALQLASQSDVTLTNIASATTVAPLSADRWTRLRWTAPPSDGLKLTLRARDAGGVTLRYVQEFERWPGGVAAPPPIPPNVMPTGRSGQMFATGTLQANWPASPAEFR